ncbi:hypothetical protein C8R42DRAFT_649031 [Lentinula raphanica]|nr:hypothetical protein C8R42DRAFT_649031 [Lentinula raphanica]
MTIEQRRESELCWRRGLRPEDRWIVATQAFGQGVDYASVRTVIHKDPMELINFFQETGRAGRDGDPARCFCFWTELPPPAPDLKNDHLGRADMIMLLQTTACIRMSFASLDRETHSCLALNASPCMNCERLSLVPHAVAPVDLPNFNKPLVPNLPNDSSQLVPLSVPINAAMLSAKYDQGLEQLLLFKRILDDVEQCGCLDCWVKCDFHNTTTTHKRPWAFDPSLATLLRLKMKSGDFWPFCYNCWIPFREPCNHPPTEPYQKLDRDRCTHVWDDPTTGKLVPVVPTLIALIFTSRQELVTEMAQNLGQKWHTIGLLTDWLHEKVQSPSSAPNPVIFINFSYCSYVSTSHADISDHIFETHHQESITDRPVHMVHQGVAYRLHTAGRPDKFLCPSCNTIGSKAVVWDHFIHAHNSKRKRAEEVGSSGLELDPVVQRVAKKAKYSGPSPPITPPPFSSSPMTSSSGSSLQLPSSQTAATSVASTSQTTIQPSFDPNAVVLDTQRILKDHSPTHVLFHFLHHAMSPIIRHCAYHHVMLKSHPESHHQLWRCPKRISHKNSEYKKEFTIKLVAQDGACCFKCWTPQDPIFHHGTSGCDIVDGDQWEQWWRAVPYLVFRTEYLRTKVFDVLGIPVDTFPTLRSFASWLTLSAQDTSDPEYDFRITNLIVLVYVYFRFSTESSLVIGTGLVLDRIAYGKDKGPTNVVASDPTAPTNPSTNCSS